jgi:SAM-dependent methyltransferase
MENADEAHRLDLKTDQTVMEQQARWAGIQPGMRVADIGCGSGKTTLFLHRLVQPGGRTVGIDASEERLRHAREHHPSPGIDYVRRDLYEPLEGLEPFDFIWVRFVLEYHRRQSFDIVRNIASLLKPGGVLCLIDLDHNCLCHHGMSPRLEQTIAGIMSSLEDGADFDPYIGRKLYSFLYDLEFADIDVAVAAHHLIYGKLNEIDAFNWRKKVEVAAKQGGYDFQEYGGDYDAFFREFTEFFSDPRRFTYTPIISCRGRKPW